jgi:hypothetical protein
MRAYPFRWQRSRSDDQRRPRPAPRTKRSPCCAAATDGACELLDQRTAVHAGIDPHHRRRRLYADVDQRTGLTTEKARSLLNARPQMRRALYRVPHLGTSFSKKPIVGYWEILAPIIALGLQSSAIARSCRPPPATRRTAANLVLALADSPASEPRRPRQESL